MRLQPFTWAFVTAVATLGVSCASVTGPSYNASSLHLFLASQATRLDEPDFTLLAGRLHADEETTRILGPRSGRLARECVVVQVTVSAGGKPIRLSTKSLRLQFSLGEPVEPLTADQVLAAVSLPEEYWKTPPGNAPLKPLERSSLPGDQGTSPYGAEMGFAALIITGFDLAIHHAGAEKYRDQGRADVEQKTALPREAAPGARLDLLLVYLRPPATIAKPGPLRLLVDIDVGGRRVERGLALE